MTDKIKSGYPSIRISPFTTSRSELVVLLVVLSTESVLKRHYLACIPQPHSEASCRAVSVTYIHICATKNTHKQVLMPICA